MLLKIKFHFFILQAYSRNQVYANIEIDRKEKFFCIYHYEASVYTINSDCYKILKETQFGNVKCALTIEKKLIVK